MILLILPIFRLIDGICSLLSNCDAISWSSLTFVIGTFKLWIFLFEHSYALLSGIIIEGKILSLPHFVERTWQFFFFGWTRFSKILNSRPNGRSSSSIWQIGYIFIWISGHSLRSLQSKLKTVNICRNTGKNLTGAKCLISSVILKIW